MPAVHRGSRAGEVVCCVDIGTSQIKVGLVDPEGAVTALVTAHMPAAETWKDLLVFDAAAVADAVCATVRDAVRNGPASARVTAVSVTNQRASVVAVGRDGRPLCPAVSWQDTASGPAMDDFIRVFGAERFTETTGLPPSALWSLAKILGLRKVAPDVGAAGARFVLLHDYLLAHLGAERFVTDPSNASVTGLLDIAGLDWSPAILEAAGLHAGQLPEVAPAGTVAGAVSRAGASATGLAEGTPLVVGGGDQQCATLGVGAVGPGDAGLCLGTAAVVSCPVERPVVEVAGGFFCTAHVVPGRWVLEGIHNAFGSSVLWMCEAVGCGSLGELDALAGTSAVGARGVMFLPYLAGIGSPDYDARAAGTVVGLKLDHGRAELARAALEGTAFEMRRILEALGRHTRVERLLVGGGRLAGPVARQVLADVLGRELVMVENRNTSLLGVAAPAWTGAGRYGSVVEAEAKLSLGEGERVEPGPARAAYEDLYRAYEQLVGRVRSCYAGWTRAEEEKHT